MKNQCDKTNHEIQGIETSKFRSKTAIETLEIPECDNRGFSLGAGTGSESRLGRRRYSTFATISHGSLGV